MGLADDLRSFAPDEELKELIRQRICSEEFENRTKELSTRFFSTLEWDIKDAASNGQNHVDGYFINHVILGRDHLIPGAPVVDIKEALKRTRNSVLYNYHYNWDIINESEDLQVHCESDHPVLGTIDLGYSTLDYDDFVYAVAKELTDLLKREGFVNPLVKIYEKDIWREHYGFRAQVLNTVDLVPTGKTEKTIYIAVSW